MVLTALSFGGMFFTLYRNLDQRLPIFDRLAVLRGWPTAVAVPVPQCGDVIDYDEYKTDERKEGSYFAAWNFVYKSALGVMLLLTGFVLDFAGFVPNVEQTMQVKLAMVSLYGLFPLVCYIIGAILFSRFTLDAVPYQVIRTELDAWACAENNSDQSVIICQLPTLFRYRLDAFADDQQFAAVRAARRTRGRFVP